jgi:hypothetical protein
MAPKYSFRKWVVKGKFASPRCHIFLARIDDLHSKSAQNGRFGHPLTTRRSHYRQLNRSCQSPHLAKIYEMRSISKALIIMGRPYALSQKMSTVNGQAQTRQSLF